LQFANENTTIIPFEKESNYLYEYKDKLDNSEIKKNPNFALVNIPVTKDEIINTNLPNLVYISIPNDIARQIVFSSSIYTKKILKTSSDLYLNFIELIKDKYYLDYFMVHG
jgi:hypothetical protein